MLKQKTMAQSVLVVRFVSFALLTGIICLACGGSPPTTREDLIPPAPTKDVLAETAIPPSPTVESGEAQETPLTAGWQGTDTARPEASTALAAAKAHLGTLLGATGCEIQVLLVEEVVWSDTSLGCPLPGVAYAPVLTPGYRVTLATGSRTYEYHTTSHDQVILCTEDERPSLPVIPVKPEEIRDGNPWMPNNQ